MYIYIYREAAKKVPPLVRPIRHYPLPLSSLVVIGNFCFFVVFRASKKSFSSVVRPLPHPPLSGRTTSGEPLFAASHIYKPRGKERNSTKRYIYGCLITIIIIKALDFLCLSIKLI